MTWSTVLPLSGDVAPQAANEALVGVRVDVELDVHQFPERVFRQHEDALEQYDPGRTDRDGLLASRVRLEVVYGLLDRLCRF